MGHSFPTANNFSWVGTDFIQETGYDKPDPTIFSANPLLVQWLVNREHREYVEPLVESLVMRERAIYIYVHVRLNVPDN